MSRLWQRQGRCAAAYHLLVEIYSWFTEGFDTVDLQEAKVLLKETGGTMSMAKLSGRERLHVLPPVGEATHSGSHW
jgi:hypothetical protein